MNHMTQFSPHQNSLFISVKNDALDNCGHKTSINKQLKQCFFQCLIQVYKGTIIQNLRIVKKYTA